MPEVRVREMEVGGDPHAPPTPPPAANIQCVRNFPAKSEKILVEIEIVVVVVVAVVVVKVSNASHIQSSAMGRKRQRFSTKKLWF